MNRLLGLLGCVAFCIVLLAPATAQDKLKGKKGKKKADKGLTLEKLFPKVSPFGPSATSMAFSHDGKFAAFLYRTNKERRHGSDLWIVDVEKQTKKRVTNVVRMAEFQTSARKVKRDRIEKAKKHLKKEKKKESEAEKLVKEGWVDDKDADAKTAPRYSGISRIAWSPKKNELLFRSGNDLYRFDVAKDIIERLTMSRKRKSFFEYLPDSSGFVFVESDGLSVIRFGSHFQQQVVAISVPRSSSSSSTTESISSFKVSPDGKFVAIAITKSSPVPNGRNVKIATYRDRFMSVREVPRQVSDDPVRPREVAIRVYELGTKPPTVEPESVPLVHMHKYSGPRDRISGLNWSLDSKKISFSTFKQTTERVEFFVALLKDIQKEASKVKKSSSSEKKSSSSTDEKKPLAKVVYQFLHNGGPNTPQMIEPIFIADNRHLVYVSEQSGFRQLHLMDPLYESQQPVTIGAFEVYPIALSPDRKHFFVTATKEHPSRTDVYAVDLEAKKMKRLSISGGSYSSAAVSPTGKSVLANYVAFGKLRELVLTAVDKKKEVALTDSHSDSAKKLVEVKPEFFTYPNREGQTIYGHVIKPDGWKKGGKYPLLIYVYGGPLGTRKSVVDGTYHSSGYFFALYMAKRHGYVTCTIDPRGQSGYGAKFEKANFEQVGRPQVRDLTDGVKYMIENYGADAERVAIHGWSFGGFQTQMCMFLDPEVFKVGIAGAGPTEWENYNKWYSTGTIGKTKEGTPELKKFSLLPLAKKLKGPLLLIHGMEDPNVLFQDTVRVYRELLKAGKGPLVELFLDPTGGHGLGGDVNTLNRMKKYEAFLLQHVKKAK